MNKKLQILFIAATVTITDTKLQAAARPVALPKPSASGTLPVVQVALSLTRPTAVKPSFFMPLPQGERKEAAADAHQELPRETYVPFEIDGEPCGSYDPQKKNDYEPYELIDDRDTEPSYRDLNSKDDLDRDLYNITDRLKQASINPGQMLADRTFNVEENLSSFLIADETYTPLSPASTSSSSTSPASPSLLSPTVAERVFIKPRRSPKTPTTLTEAKSPAGSPSPATSPSPVTSLSTAALSCSSPELTLLSSIPE